MPSMELTLRELLTDEELNILIWCIKGHSDLYLDHYELYHKLYNYYLPDMPYGTAKARDGDPVNWILLKTRFTLFGSEQIPDTAFNKRDSNNEEKENDKD